MTSREEERIAKGRQRAAEALAMRRAGLLLREIGARLGVQRERARQLVLKGERIERHAKNPGLPTARRGVE